MTSTIGDDACAIVVTQIERALCDRERVLVAIAGPPATGKSTFADQLCVLLESRGIKSAVAPMDGFHLDNHVLNDLGLTLSKGAPETFDVDGFISLVERLGRPKSSVYLPIFDRERDLAIAGARHVGPEVEAVIFEGNYLLYDRDPWRGLAPLWDLSVWLDTPEQVLCQRSVSRWLSMGKSLQDAQARANGNDLVNARKVISARLPSDITIG